jgi:excisionase family DNA binding protein
MTPPAQSQFEVVNAEVSGRGSEKNLSETAEVDHLWTVVEAAHFLNLSHLSLYHLVSQKRVPVIRISSRCIRFSQRALLAWIENLTQEPKKFSGGDKKSASATSKQPSSVSSVRALGQKQIKN